MDDKIILSNLVRIGTVSAVDAGKKSARVIYKDNGTTSGWLRVLQHGGAVVNVEPNGEHTHAYSGSTGAAGDPSHSHEYSSETASEPDHIHEARVTVWMPSVNDTVLVLYLPVFNGDGFILGAI
jgi:hypothetical protein